MKEIEIKCWMCEGTGKRKKSVFTEEEIDKIKAMKAMDFSGRQIAKELGVPHQAVNEYLRGGIAAKGKRLDKK